MIEDMENLLNIDTKNKTYTEKIEIIEKKLFDKILVESDYFNFISLYGLFFSFKISSICLKFFMMKIFFFSIMLL